MVSAEAPRVLFLCSGNYYRSRFAEALFNHLAPAAGLPHRADSAGLHPDCHTYNPGPMSPHTRAALEKLGVALPAVLRPPRDVRESDLASAALTIALKDAEHRPMIARSFPAWLERVEFWHVDDVPDAPPSIALPMIEERVHELIARLARANAPRE